MKSEVSNLKHLKKLNAKPEINHSSVSFPDVKSVTAAKPKKAEMDFLDELKNAISSGDDTIWRIWR